VSLAYSASYLTANKNYIISNHGTAESFVSQLSVQFLNRLEFVEEMVKEAGFIDTLGLALYDQFAQEDLVPSNPYSPQLSSSSFTTDQPLYSKIPLYGRRKYNSLFGDIRTLFALPGFF